MPFIVAGSVTPGPLDGITKMGETVLAFLGTVLTAMIAEPVLCFILVCGLICTVLGVFVQGKKAMKK